MGKLLSILLLFCSQNVLFGNETVREIPLKDHYGVEYFENGDWHFIDLKTQTVFLNLDNETIASADDIALDPFLALRTKIGQGDHKIESSLAYFAHFEAPCSTFDQEQAMDSSGPLSPLSTASTAVVNGEAVFQSGNPYFLIQAEGSQIHWQISPKPFEEGEFHPLTPNFESIQGYTSEVILDSFTATFFNSDQTYYFRVKAKDSTGWTRWSEPFAFQIDKPAQVREVSFRHEENGDYVISWESENSPDTRYHIFASNSLDFIPTPYFDQHVLKMDEEQIIEAEPNGNLLFITDNTQIKIGTQYAFYRIVAEKNGVFSVPSPIVRFFSEEVALRRDVLKSIGSRIQRVALPSTSHFKGTFVYSGEYSTKQPVNVSDEIWNEITPFLMPDNHPAKEKLDRIFAKSGVISTMKTMKHAGFSDMSEGNLSHMTVAKHKKLKGYLLKLFRDEQKDMKDWKQCVNRVTGAQAIREAIGKHDYNKMMKVPHKWIYCIPENSKPGYEGKNFILVVEDMNLVSESHNNTRWRSPSLPQSFLRAVFIIINEVGLIDSVQIFNIPFCKDGRIAFIDTEYHHKWPIPWHVIKQYLCPESQEYWESLKREHGIP